MLKKLLQFKRSSKLAADYYRNEIREFGKYDVVVVGGGISGIFTAISSAQNGARTILIEQGGALGGLVTLGYIPPISHQFCDINGNLITKGLVREFIQKIADAGGTLKDWTDWKIPKLCIDIETFKMVTYQFMKEYNISVLLGTTFITIKKQHNKIESIIIHNKSGFQEIKAKFFVDCSGEAELALSAGVPCTVKKKDEKKKGGNENQKKSIKSLRDLGKMEQMMKKIGWERPTQRVATLQFQVGQVDFNKLYDYVIKNPDSYYVHFRGELIEDLDLFKYLWKKGMVYFTHRDNFLTEMDNAINTGRYSNHLGKYRLMKEGSCSIDGLLSTGLITVTSNKIPLDPYNSREISSAMIDGQSACFMTYHFFKEYIPGFENSTLIAVAPMMGIRRTTQIIGKHVYTLEEREKQLEYDDVIGLTSRKTKGIDEIPFACTVPQNIENLLIGSGKIVSTDDLLLYRTKAHCMVIGQAVGAAAAMCAKNSWTINDINIKKLQKQLIINGVYLGNKKRLNELGI